MVKIYYIYYMAKLVGGSEFTIVGENTDKWWYKKEISEYITKLIGININILPSEEYDTFEKIKDELEINYFIYSRLKDNEAYLIDPVNNKIIELLNVVINDLNNGSKIFRLADKTKIMREIKNKSKTVKFNKLSNTALTIPRRNKNTPKFRVTNLESHNNPANRSGLARSQNNAFRRAKNLEEKLAENKAKQQREATQREVEFVNQLEKSTYKNAQKKGQKNAKNRNRTRRALFKDEFSGLKPWNSNALKKSGMNSWAKKHNKKLRKIKSKKNKPFSKLKPWNKSALEKSGMKNWVNKHKSKSKRQNLL